MLPLAVSLLLALLRLVLAAPSAQCDLHHATSCPGRTPKKLVFVLAGQSNMAGRGGVSGDLWDGAVPPQCRPSASILRLSARLRWEVAREPLHADVDVNKTCGVGPGMAFAHAMLSSVFWAARPPLVVGLVPCAVGGTRIEEWARGTALYDGLVRRAKAAGGKLGAVLWYQGESDTVSREDAEAYRARMERLILHLRSDLELPGLLLIQVAIASGEGNFTEIVRKAQKDICLPNVACVDAKGLQLEADHLHLTTSAQVQLGEMLAGAYLTHAMSK
ncbi:unnamed protein product [Musa textilis]